MALYAHADEDDPWDAELSDDDEASLFSVQLPKKLPQLPSHAAPATEPRPASMQRRPES